MYTTENWYRKGSLAFSRDSCGNKFWCVIVKVERNRCYTVGGTNGATHGSWDDKSRLEKATEDEVVDYMRLRDIPEEITRADIRRIQGLAKNG